MFLEKALAFGAVGAAHQAERPIDNMWRHPVPHHAIVIGEVLFGDADVYPINAVRVGETHFYSPVTVLLHRAPGLRRSSLRHRLPIFARMAGGSRTTSWAGLSSRTPLNAAWRTSRRRSSPGNWPRSPRRLDPDQSWGGRRGGGGSNGGRPVLMECRRLQRSWPSRANNRCRCGRHSEPAPFVVADDQSPDAVAQGGRGRIADDRELLPVGAFGLDQVSTRPGRRAIGALRHDPFEPAAGVPQHHRPVALEMRAQPDGPGLALPQQQTGKRGFALQKRQRVRSAPSRCRRSNA